MLPRRLRLSRRGFEAVSTNPKAKRASSEHFSALVSILDEDRSGCSVVVSKKVAKSAVARHLVKRRARAALHPWCSQGYGIIIFARAGSAELSFKQIDEELSQLLPRLGLSRTM